MTIVTLLLLLYLLLGLYTLAALWAARALGLRITQVSFGLGPVLWKGTARDGSELRLALLPGGFVRVKGWTREADDLTSFVEVYGERGLGKRACAALAGPLAILAAGWLAAVSYAWLVPPTHWVLPLTVYSVSSGGPADRAGLAPGDQLLRLGQHALSRFEQLAAATATCGTCEIELRRGRDLLRFSVEPAALPGTSNYVLGVMLQRRRPATDLGTALAQGSVTTASMVELQVRDLANMFIGAKQGEPSGPRLVLRAGEAHVAWGWLTRMTTLAVILAFLNLLPGPGFSGGFLLLLAIEAVIGRQLSPRREHRVLAIVMFAVIGWLVVTTSLLGL